MRRAQKPSAAVILLIAAMMLGLSACESQDQRQKIEALTKQVAELQQENSRLKQEVASLTKQADDLRIQLEEAAKKPAASRK